MLSSMIRTTTTTCYGLPCCVSTKPLPGDINADDNSAEMCNRVSCETSSPQPSIDVNCQFHSSCKDKNVHFYLIKHEIFGRGDFLHMCVSF